MTITSARLRLATDADWWRWCGRKAPGWWIGITAEDAHMLLGLGGVYLGVDDRFWAFFHKARGVSGKILMQRAARTLFDALRESGLREVSALPDLTIPGAELWLSRLGFKATDELMNEHQVWAWTP